LKEKIPSLPLTVVWVAPFVLLVKTIFAFVTTAPAGSRTVPESDAVVVWAMENTGTTAMGIPNARDTKIDR
jgi:hypothetical protein